MSVRKARMLVLKPRKTPGQSRSAETVRVILEGAARILEERGFEGYTTNAVAERAGVSVGSLYQYFPSKEALTAALIARETDLLLSAAQSARDDTDGRSGLIRLIRAAVAHQFNRPRLALLLDREENRLQVDERTEMVTEEITAAVVALLPRTASPMPFGLQAAAADVCAIVKGMVDAAGARCEPAGGDVETRVIRAVFGYLGLRAESSPFSL